MTTVDRSVRFAPASAWPINSRPRQGAPRPAARVDDQSRWETGGTCRNETRFLSRSRQSRGEPWSSRPGGGRTLAQEGDMTARIEETHIVYDGWTTGEVATIRFEDGHVIHREVEKHGTAVAVLAFDAGRGGDLLTSQCRAPILRESGDMVLEVPAGLEEGEDPAVCARREVLEETGVRLDRLINVVRAWTMPGLSTERCSLFLAEYREADRVEDGG